MKKIRVHKKVNLLPVQMKKESLINTFYGLMEKYNKQIEYNDLLLSKQELWELGGFSGKYNGNYIDGLIWELTKSDTYTVKKNHTISGSMFVTVREPNGNILINIPKPFREFMFYKRDLDLMAKAKNKKIMTTEELDHWDFVTSKKKKFLVLLKKADILGVKGKYNKRLYSLLMQFKKTGLYFTTWDKFKEIMEIPETYNSSAIDKRILTPAKKELLKVGIEITDIKKIKKGRSIDRVEIRFKCEDASAPLSNQTSTVLSHGDKEGEDKVVEMSMVKRKALSELAKKGKYHLIETLMNLKTDGEVEEFMEGMFV